MGGRGGRVRSRSLRTVLRTLIAWTSRRTSASISGSFVRRYSRGTECPHVFMILRRADTDTEARSRAEAIEWREFTPELREREGRLRQEAEARRTS